MAAALVDLESSVVAVGVAASHDEALCATQCAVSTQHDVLWSNGFG